MFDDDIAMSVEQRGFELSLLFDLNDFDRNAVVAFGQRFDAVDDRRAVVVAVGEADGTHGLLQSQISLSRKGAKHAKFGRNVFRLRTSRLGGEYLFSMPHANIS